MSPFPDALTLLIDGDNTAHDLLPQLLRLLGGEVGGRVLCNPCSHSGWAGALSRTPCRIELIRIPSRDKNAVDDRLMDLMRAGPADLPVLLVSRDADFSPCVEALERSGTPVICLSTEPPAVRLRRACSGWVELLRSGEAHYHARTCLQGPTGAVEPRAKPRSRPKPTPHIKSPGRAAAPAPESRKAPRGRDRSRTPPLDAVLTRLLTEEGVTPLPRLSALCAEVRSVPADLLAHLEARPGRYHLTGAPEQLRVSLMSPERGLFLALENVLTELGPTPLSRLIEEARARGLRSGRLPRRNLLMTLQSRPDLFRILGDGDHLAAELIR